MGADKAVKAACAAAPNFKSVAMYQGKGAQEMCPTTLGL